MSQAVTGRCLVKKEFFEVLHKLQENIWAGVLFLIRCRLQANNLVKRDSVRCISVKFANFSGITFWQDASWSHPTTRKEIICCWIKNRIKNSPRTFQFVIFKPLSHCFEETIGFDVKASFVSRPMSHLIRWYNKRILIKGYSVPRDFSWIENHKLFP